MLINIKDTWGINRLLVENKKVKKSEGKTFNFPLPAFKAATGETICHQAKDCIKPCYAQVYPYVIPVVNAAHNRNFEFSKTHHFVDSVISEISKKKKVDRIRIHDGGDFYSSEYLSKWFKIALTFPNIEFYFYTKEVGMLKEWGPIVPKNMTPIYSYGGKQDHRINPKTDRHCKVFPTSEELTAANYSDASNDDTVATGINKHVGIVYHGVASKNTFNKRRV